jgi:hypothetical protein
MQVFRNWKIRSKEIVRVAMPSYQLKKTCMAAPLRRSSRTMLGKSLRNIKSGIIRCEPKARFWRLDAMTAYAALEPTISPPGVAAIGCTAVLRLRLAKVYFSAFSFALAGDSPKSHAVDSDGLEAGARDWQLSGSPVQC